MKQANVVFHPDLLKLVTDKLICPICKNSLTYGTHMSHQPNYECLKCNLKTLHNEFNELSEKYDFNCERLYIKLYYPDYYLSINFKHKTTYIYDLYTYKQRLNSIPTNLNNLHDFVNLAKTFQ